MKSSLKSKGVSCLIQSIDSMIALNISVETTGAQLVELVFSQLGIYERHWFGLMYYDKHNNIRWLEGKKKINLKEVKPFGDTSAHFKFTIKYFPENMKTELIQDCVKELFFKYELSRLVTDPDIECLPEHRILFAVTYASLVCHQNSKAVPEEVIKKKFDRLFPSHVLKQFSLTKEEWIEAIIPSLKLSKNQHYIEPLNQALEAMEQSPMHGIFFYQIQNKNHTDLYLGIDCYGLTIYKQNDRVNPCVAFHWQEICSVSYAGKAFHIKPLAKEDPELIIYTKSARQNDEILYIIAGNHTNYLRRRQGDPGLEIETKKALKAQEVNVAERKRFENQQEANLMYDASVEKVLSSEVSDAVDKEKLLEMEFQKTKELMQKQVEEAKQIAEQERAQKAVAEMEAENLKRRSQQLEVMLEDEKKKNLPLTLSDSEKLNEDATKQRDKEIEYLTKQLEELELRHSTDLERLVKMEAAKKAEPLPATTITLPQYPVSLEDAKKRITEEQDAQIAKVAQMLKEKNVCPSSAANLIQQNVDSGKNRFTTLKLLRKNNTKARIDEFESF